VRVGPGGASEHDRSTSEIRFRADADGALSPATALGRIRIIDKGRELPVIPYSAVIEGADGPYVLVASADRKTLVKRTVQIGKIFGGLAFVLSGLGSREAVLTRGAFFVDAERRLRRQTAIEVSR
jgi:hypothetical protein